uniref:Uncharacterized protein n=1 Tax=Arundo donax TaxID=35708 RepID=A0A0A9C7K3_ARUDO
MLKSFSLFPLITSSSIQAFTLSQERN